MIFLYMLGLALLLLLPLTFAVSRNRKLQNRRDAALALHRAQMAELERDLTDARIGATEFASARLEVERRLLTADALVEPPTNGNAKFLLLATAFAIPVMAFLLYLPGSTPNIPSEPHAQWVVLQQAQQQRLAGLVSELRTKLATLDPKSADASQGQAYLAEALTEQAQQITPEALAMFKQSLADAPADASWRSLDQQRIAEAQAGS